MAKSMDHLIELITQIKKKVRPGESWRIPFQTNVGIGLGAIAAWSRHLDIHSSGEFHEEQPSGKELVTSQIDAIAANGAESVLTVLAEQEESVAARLVMEGLHQPKGLHYGPVDERRFGKAEEQSTSLLDPVDGTTNLRDGRFFDAATVVATSQPMAPDQQPTFRDVKVASIWFLSLTHNFHIEIQSILASPRGLLKLHLKPDLSILNSVEDFRPETRKMHEVVFASYYTAEPMLTKIENILVKNGYPIVPGCGSSALDCLRILHQISGAYIDLRNQIPQASACLHTYDIAAIPFLASKWAETFGADVQVFIAPAASSKINKEYINQIPLYPEPLSLILTNNIDAKTLLQHLKVN